MREQVRSSADDGWGGLPKKEQEKVLSAVKAKFPERYKELYKQYRKSLQPADDR